MLERFGRTEVMIAVAVIVVLALITIPLAMSSQQKSKRAEVPLNVDAIRAAEMDHKKLFGDFVSAAAAPRDPLSANSTPVAWQPSEGFKKLSWAPEQAEVRGVYSVTAKGDSFKVLGVCDVDDDGVQARFEATEANAATQLNDGSVY